jgi:cytochrome oxidase assembly protein ShyY1
VYKKKKTKVAVNKFLRPVAVGLALLVLSGIFFELGIWQWHRAQATSAQGKVIPSAVPIALTEVDKAGRNISTKAVNRIVTVQGRYIKDYVAPTQNIGADGYKDLSVGLFEITGNRAILIVRGLHDGSITPTSGQLDIQGRLYPRQQEDHGFNSATSLGRIDPALVAGTGHYSLFDGYIIAISEKDGAGKEIKGNRVPAPVLMQSISGFYWQHIAYVVIWWFMAILVLFAPLIAKRNERNLKARELEVE